MPERTQQCGRRVDRERQLAEVVVVRPDRHVELQSERGECDVVRIAMLEVAAGFIDVRSVLRFVVKTKRQVLDGFVENVDWDPVTSGE
jgi:hypothetical protein